MGQCQEHFPELETSSSGEDSEDNDREDDRLSPAPDAERLSLTPGCTIRIRQATCNIPDSISIPSNDDDEGSVEHAKLTHARYDRAEEPVGLAH
jgi:hypothetical protein